MRPTQILRAGKEKMPGKYLTGVWGSMSTTPQKGIIHYGIAQNRLNPLSGVWQAAIFNTFRRSRNQILYWAVPMIIAYETMEWATERNHFLSSKKGREIYGDM